MGLESLLVKGGSFVFGGIIGLTQAFSREQSVDDTLNSYVLLEAAPFLGLNMFYHALKEPLSEFENKDESTYWQNHVALSAGIATGYSIGRLVM